MLALRLQQASARTEGTSEQPPAPISPGSESFQSSTAGLSWYCQREQHVAPEVILHECQGDELLLKPTEPEQAPCLVSDGGEFGPPQCQELRHELEKLRQLL